MYAVIEDRGRQYKVSEGDVVRVDRRDAEPGDKIEFDHVLLVSGDDGVQVGKPTVAGAGVAGVVEGEVKGRKVVTMHFRRRKDSRTRTGHRQKYTAVRIESISLS